MSPSQSRRRLQPNGRKSVNRLPEKPSSTLCAKEQKQKVVSVDLNPASGIALFTDGSSWNQDGSGGWAWVAIDAFTGLATGSGAVSDTTNNRMEMQAWIEGLNALYDALGACDVLVYCDSQIVGRGFTGEYKRKQNLDLWEELDVAAEKHEDIEWIWVKGHSDSLYNDLADKLASKARKHERITHPYLHDAG